MLAAISLLVIPFNALIPVYAKVIFKGTASTFGLIDALVGAGAFSAAIFLASLKTAKNLRIILAVNTLIFGTGLILFSDAHSFPLALAFAALTGFGMMSQITISNTLIQTSAAPEMRGRVISFYAMAFFGMLPIGSLLVGWLSQFAGIRLTIFVEGIIALFISILHFSQIYHSAQKNRAPIQVQPFPATENVR